MSALQSVEHFVDWLAKAFGDKREQADVTAGESILAFWQNPSPATKAAMVASVEAAISVNAAAMTPSQPAAAPVAPEGQTPEAGAGGTSIYTGPRAIK